MLFSYPSLSKRSLAVINPLPGVTSPIPIENPRLPKIEKFSIFFLCLNQKFDVKIKVYNHFDFNQNTS